MTRSSRAGTAAIVEALGALRAGGVVAIPTDTVYGLAAALDQPAAIARIYALKGRDDGKPIPVLVSDPATAASLSVRLPEAATKLAQHFWPGPLTLVVPAGRAVPAGVLRGGSTVGLRMPAHTMTLELLAAAGGALAVTSANRSGDREALSAGEVYELFGETVDVIVDGGVCTGGRASTVVEVQAGGLRLLRAGELSEAALLAALGDTPWR